MMTSAMTMKIAVVHGPNLNRLGTREPEIYGATCLDDLNKSLEDQAACYNIHLSTFQSNHEGALIEAIQNIHGQAFDGIIINPAGYTHTSIALRDTLCASDIPFIEVHISNIFAREPFRQHSYFSDKALGVISGLGIIGYRLALDAFIQRNKLDKCE